MSGVVNNGYYTDVFSDTLAGGTPPTYQLRLYSNNHTPTQTDTPSAFTECSGSGYAHVNLTPGNWTVATVSGSVKATYPGVVFTFTGALTIYGYYVVDSGGVTVKWAELAVDGPFVFSAAGGTLTVSLELDGP